MHENIYKMQQITVYIEGYNSIAEYLYIKNVLRKIFSVQAVMFCESMELCDVIVTKRIISIESGQKIFYMDDIFSEEKWKELMSYLINKIIDNQGSVN